MQEPADDHSVSAQPTRLVSVGASAGGIEALQQLLEGLPVDTGMAFLVIQHLSPDFKSVLSELLSRHTRLKVVSVDADTRLAPDTVYVLAAGVGAQVQGAQLIVKARPRSSELHLPIDDVFASMEGWGEKAAAVVLSGTGRDGTQGALRLARAGGLVVAQAPNSARFDGMPRSVIAAGCVDIIALPNEIGPALAAWLHEPESARSFASADDAVDPRTLEAYSAVLAVLRQAADVDFVHYKVGTMLRRLERWDHVNGERVTPTQLAERMQADPALTDALFRDLLIGVTRFLRDPDAFEALRTQVIEPAIQKLPEGEHFRIWCCGCSSGEEAYTLAMLVHEAFERCGRQPLLRMHATDLSSAAVQKASNGLFAEQALDVLPMEWRAKYFRQQASGLFKVAEHLRSSIVFSVHNLLRDAPFPRLDLVVCRNLLIYLRSGAQSQSFGAFYTGLREGGALFLGSSEMPGQADDVFDTINEGARLYRKRSGLQLPLHMRPQFALQPVKRPAVASALDARANLRLHEVLSQRFVPRGFLVNQADELVYLFGDAGRLLDPGAGSFGNTLQHLLKGPLRAAVMLAMRRAVHSDATVIVGDLVDDPDHPGAPMRVEVDRISDPKLPQAYFLVRMVPLPTADSPVDQRAVVLAPDSFAAEHIADLEAELQRMRQALQHTVEDLETANEELQSSNEELQSSNEELQTSNEELHALNEELYSVNAEHELKITQLRNTTNDLNNLLRAAEVAIIFLDMDCRLRLFTPPAAALFPMRGHDIGRDLRELVPREQDAALFDDIARVVSSCDTLITELTLADGRTMRRRIAPYRTDDRQVQGIVLTYLDITEQLQLREQALALQAKAQLDAIIASVPHLMWTSTAAGEFDFLNAQWVAYTGVPAQDQLGSRWLQAIHPDDRDLLWGTWARCVAGAERLQGRFRMRRHDGQYRWFDMRGVPQLDQAGFVRRWYGSNTDVHEAVELTESLRRHDQFLRMVADNVNGMIGYWDLEQRNRFANRHYLEWFGRRQAEMEGITLRELQGEAVYELNRPHIEAALRGEEQHFTREIHRPDGSVGHLLAEYWPHFVDGELHGFLATATDITLVQEERRLVEEIFRASPLAKLVVDVDGRITRANEAAADLTRYDMATLLTLSVEDLVPEDLRAHHLNLRHHFVLKEGRRPMGAAPRFPLRRADGTLIEVDIELVKFAAGGKPATIVYVRSALSLADQGRADAGNQARSAFLAQMSHEIRTPLNAVLGMTQLLALDQPTARQADRLKRIEEASTHLLGIVEDILDYSKIEAGRLELHLETFRVRDLVERARQMVADRAQVKHLSLESAIDLSVPEMLVGDARRIEQILVNYLTNAIKFTPAGSVKVHVGSATASNNRLMLRVEVLDTGIGISATDQAELFKPFQQVNQGHSRLFGGTGLGLAISRQLARAMQGDCGVRSEPGKGSTFWFNVHVARCGPDAAPPHDASSTKFRGVKARKGGRKNQHRVLLVEDDEVNQLVAVEMIQAIAGIRADTAADGPLALKAAAAQRYDLVLMDMQLPGIDGLEATRQIRQLPGYAEVPIYALSANVMADDVNACLAAGMDGHLGKPLRAADLSALLQRLWNQG